MNTHPFVSHLSKSLLALSIGAALSACGGGGGEAPPGPGSGGPSEAQRIAAAQATVGTNTKCSAATLGSFYWEIGDAYNVKVSGSVGVAPPNSSTRMLIYSASKLLYAANVVQKRGVLDVDVPYLNLTSGYTKFGNDPICTGIAKPGMDPTTVQACMVGRAGKDLSTVDHFFYDNGHMQQHAAYEMQWFLWNPADMAVDLNTTLGHYGFDYAQAQPASGVVVSTRGYATFLQRLLTGEITLSKALGTHKVCTNAAVPGCNALSSPSMGTEAWNYSLGHWVEDDPVVGDHAFSSAGDGGFYPWIDSAKTHYGILARERAAEGDAGYHSAECGRLIRQAWRTGVAVTAGLPTP